MIFFAQKALRKVSGRYSFVVVTDRAGPRRPDLQELRVDRGGDRAPGRRVGSAGDVGRRTSRSCCDGDHRYVFTLIQKFRTETGETYPVLSERDDIIVIADEAHRTQYDTLALNLRNALRTPRSWRSPARR